MENKEKNGRREVSGWSVSGFKSVKVAVRKGELFGLWDTRVAGLGQKEAESMAFVQSHKEAYSAQFKKMPCSQETSAWNWATCRGSVLSGSRGIHTEAPQVRR